MEFDFTPVIDYFPTLLKGVGVTLLIGLAVARRVGGDSTNFLVGGRNLALPLVGAALMGQAVDTNATLGNTDLSSAFGFWAGAALPLGLGLCLLLTGLFFAIQRNDPKMLRFMIDHGADLQHRAGKNDTRAMGYAYFLALKDQRIDRNRIIGMLDSELTRQASANDESQSKTASTRTADAA